MEGEHKSVALVILGIVSVIAVVGLVLLFTQTKSATGQGVYGGAIKGLEYPYWTGRGVPRNIPGEDLWPATAGRVMNTHWNYYGTPQRDPKGDVPSALSGCPGGFSVGYGQGDLPYYYSQIEGCQVIETPDKAGVCVYCSQPMVGGIAGYT